MCTFRAGQDRHAGSKLFLNTLKGHSDTVNGLSFSADGLSLATACDDRSVRVFSLNDVAGKVGFKSRSLRKAPADVAFGTNSQHVAVLTRGESGCILRAASARGGRELKEARAVMALAAQGPKAVCAPHHNCFRAGIILWQLPLSTALCRCWHESERELQLLAVQAVHWNALQRAICLVPRTAAMQFAWCLVPSP